MSDRHDSTQRVDEQALGTGWECDGLYQKPYKGVEIKAAEVARSITHGDSLPPGVRCRKPPSAETVHGSKLDYYGVLKIVRSLLTNQKKCSQDS